MFGPKHDQFRMLGALALAVIVAPTYAFCRGVLRAVGSEDRATTWALTLAALSSGPVSLCRVLGDLALSGAAFGAIMLIGALALRRDGSQDGATRKTRFWSSGMAVAVVPSMLVASAAFGGYWWDEHNCHNGLVQVLARGIAPPVHPLFPSESFRYHYGFDALAALVRCLTEARVDLAIDLTTLACWAVLLGMVHTAGARLGGTIGGNLAVFLVPFGGGFLGLFFWTEAGPLVFRWSAIPASWLAQASPPSVIAHFFQHPQGLGMPLSLAALTLSTDANLNPGRWVVVGVLLGILSLAQIVFFIIVGFALFVMAVARFARHRKVTPILWSASGLSIAVAVAWALGGMVGAGSPPLELGRSFFQGSPLDRTGLHLVHFGAPLVLTVWAVATLHRRATPLRRSVTIAAATGFLVPNVAVYTHSWDIVKFYGVGAFFANLVMVDLLAPWIRQTGPKRTAAAGVVAISTLASVLWLLRMGPLDGRFGVPRLHFPPPSPIALRTAERLAPLMNQEDRVFSTNVDLGLSGGLLTPGFDWRRVGRGFMLDRAEADRLMIHGQRARRSLRDEDLDALRVRFVVMSPWDIAGLSQAGRHALYDEARFERLFKVRAEDGIRFAFRRRNPGPP